MQEIVVATGTSHGTEISISNEQVGLRKLSAKWVPRVLTIAFKCNCVTILRQ